MPRAPLRVAVLGGGVLGVSTAAALAKGGADVTLLTEAGLASGASGRTLSWLNSYGRRSPAYHELRLLGMERYRAHAQLPRASGYLHFGGALSWVDPEGLESQRLALQQMRATGYPARWLEASEVAAQVPGVAPAAVPVHGAVLTPNEGWVDVPALVDVLASEVVAHGGQVRCGVGKAKTEASRGRVAAVSTRDGSRLDVDAVVIATGADVPADVDHLGVRLPDATAMALLVRTEPVDSGLRAVLNTPRVSLRPTPSGGLVMDSATSGTTVRETVDGRLDVPPAAIDTLLHDAAAVLAGHPALAVAAVGAGPKPVPADELPVIGELDQVPGCFVAFTHSGATLALIVGELLAREVLGAPPSPLLAEFRPSRFA